MSSTAQTSEIERSTLFDHFSAVIVTGIVVIKPSTSLIS